MLAQSWKFGVNCCSIGLTHPAACTGALVLLAFGHVHRPPFYPICSKRVAIDWAGDPKTKTTSGTPSRIRLICVQIDSSPRQDFEYIVYNRFDTCHPKIMLPDASWCNVLIYVRVLRAQVMVK